MYSEILLRAGRAVRIFAYSNLPVPTFLLMHPAHFLSTSGVLGHSPEDGSPANILVNFVLKDGTVKQTMAREGEIALRNTNIN